MLRKRNSGITTISIDNVTKPAISLATSSSYIHDPSLSVSSQTASSALVETGPNFEISNSNNLKFSSNCGLCTKSSHSSSSQFFQMESECDESMSTMKNDPDPPDSLCPSNENIMNVLMAISNQMMANTQDLQNQILRNHQDLQDQLIQK
jgi:hypothetical protein